MNTQSRFAGNDAKLKQLVVDWFTQHAAQQAITDHEDYDPSWDEQDRLEKAIADTSAESFNGVLFKLRWLVGREKVTADDAPEPVEVLRSTLADFERLKV